MRRLFEKIIPFFLLGIAIVAMVAGLVLLSYLFLFGAIVGLLLFVFTQIKQKFFPSKKITPYNQRKHEGRTFEHDDKAP